MIPTHSEHTFIVLLEPSLNGSSSYRQTTPEVFVCTAWKRGQWLYSGDHWDRNNIRLNDQRVVKVSDHLGDLQRHRLNRQVWELVMALVSWYQCRQHRLWLVSVISFRLILLQIITKSETSRTYSDHSLKALTSPNLVSSCTKEVSKQDQMHWYTHTHTDTLTHWQESWTPIPLVGRGETAVQIWDIIFCSWL